jgi:hypothetical protein
MYRQRLPQLDGGLFLTDSGIETTLIFGGCCGTDHRHVTSICAAWLADARVRT